MSCDCDLCKRERKTTLYYEDDKIWVVECESCHVPMAVWKEHKSSLAIMESEYIVRMALERIPIKMSGYKVDPVMRNIPEHVHVHFR